MKKRVNWWSPLKAEDSPVCSEEGKKDCPLPNMLLLENEAKVGRQCKELVLTHQTLNQKLKTISYRFFKKSFKVRLGLLVLPNICCEISYNSDIKAKNGENAKNVTSMPASIALAFMEILSKACGCEGGDCEQKVIEKVLMTLWGLCCHSSAANKDKTC